MPVEFLTDEEVATYGRFNGPPSRVDLERCFLPNDRDRELVRQRRRAHNRLGFALQLGTVRFLGTILPDPLDVPAEVVAYQARQLGIEDVSCLSAYAEREMTPLEADYTGAVLFLEAADATEARGHIDTFPLVQHGVAAIELIELVPPRVVL